MAIWTTGRRFARAMARRTSPMGLTPSRRKSSGACSSSKRIAVKRRCASRPCTRPPRWAKKVDGPSSLSPWISTWPDKGVDACLKECVGGPSSQAPLRLRESSRDVRICPELAGDPLRMKFPAGSHASDRERTHSRRSTSFCKRHYPAHKRPSGSLTAERLVMDSINTRYRPCSRNLTPLRTSRCPGAFTKDLPIG
ncbi:hypothetical protein PSAB6_340139 [Paraburkholderia sabiae]|nr:hypothetical protein PSAB6_340139 [Paraburkholderia sabiae]